MDALYKLIKSLRKSEKRFFRLHAGRHVKGENNILKLFNEIEKQKEYDEEKLKKHFKGTTLSKYLAFNKHYLYKQILKSLHNFYSASHAENIIREQTHYIKILFDRRLLDDCEKLVEKTILLAKKYEAFPELIRLLEWKIEVMVVRLFEGYEEKEITEIENEFRSAIESLQEFLLQYLSQQKLYFGLQKRGLTIFRSKSGEYKKMVAAIEKSTPKGFRSRILKEYFLEVANRNISGDESKAEKNVKNILSLTEQFPHMTKNNPRHRMAALYNLALNKLMVRDNSSAQEIADEMKKFTETTRLSIGQMQTGVYLHATVQMGIYTNELNYAAAEEYYKHYLQKRKTFSGLEPNHSHEKVITYVMGHLSFNAGKYKEAVHHLSAITVTRHSSARSDIDGYARILQLFSFFVIGNTLSLETSARSLEKSMAKQNNLYRIEKTALDFVRRNTKHIHNRAALKEQYDLLKKDLENIRGHGSKEEKIAIEYIDLENWAEKQAK